MRDIRTILEMHGFKTYRCTRSICNTILTYQITFQSIAGINMHTWFRCIYFHLTTTFSVVYPCSHTLVIALGIQYPCMIVTTGYLQLVIFFIYTGTHCLRQTEIEWSTFYIHVFTGYTFLFIIRCHSFGIYPHHLVFHRLVEITGYIKERMMRQIKHRRFVGGGCIG